MDNGGGEARDLVELVVETLSVDLGSDLNAPAGGVAQSTRRKNARENIS